MHHAARDPPGTASDLQGSPGKELLLVGANHRTASIAEREALVRKATYPRIRTLAGRSPPWTDLILLTTCNRIEAYVATESAREASKLLGRALEIPSGSPTLYVLKGPEAAAHLLRVASGLDSLAQGEEQVMAQVRKAASRRPASWRSDGSLASVFAQAARAAPRIRAGAGLDTRHTSASHAAIRFVEATLPRSRPRVVLIGTGKMARIAAQALEGRATLVCLNRSPRRVRGNASRPARRVEGLAQLETSMARADVIVAATASPRPLVTHSMVRRALRARPDRPLLLIDLAFPRNIDPRCHDLDGVTLVDLDGLAPWASQPLPPAALARVESRIREDATRILASLRPSGDADVVRLRKAVEALRQQEVAAALARLPALSEEHREVVDKLATRLVNRFLHTPTERLRELPEATRARIVHEIVLGLDGEERRR